MRVRARSTSLAAMVAVAATTWVSADGPQKLGTGVTLGAATPIAQILAQPADYAGKTVAIEGVATAVCTHMGCWLAVTETADRKSAGEKTIRLKVDDGGAIVFPVSAKGRFVRAQGVFERVGAHDAEGQEAAGEQAKQAGRPASDASQWQIKATGAVIE